ncbi:MAG: MarR family transcriptional regulator [Candidatus Omnitrophica bacterium]|nr:MarR family transcriptional regulator [Candidatus Omnitrophota bacterium]HOX54068.1 MarR family transcriptional regulator [Candidatus Omnitrophota bacterium]
MDRVEQIVKEISMLMPKMMRRMHRGNIAYSDIPISQLTIMMAVAEQGTTQATKLCKEMKVSAPSITGIVDRLVRTKYIRRTPDKKDRRVINLTLTEKGQREIKTLRDRMCNRWKSILMELTPEDREVYLSLMKKILVILEKENGS